MYPLSVEKRISDRLKDLDLSADNLSVMSRLMGHGVSGPKLSAAIRGARSLENETGLFLLGILDVTGLI
jgi:hypothetical protein